jgi:uncharacterized protein
MRVDVERLLDPAAYPHPTRGIHLIETHISWVFLTGDYVYKLKKPCNLGFLDFSSPEKRHACCLEEVRLSGRFAPELYLGVVPITGSPASPHIDGSGAPFEWAVKLRQFDEASRLDRLFADHRLSADDCERLGVEIAAVQARLAVATASSPWGTAQAVGDAVRLNLAQLRAARPDTAALDLRLEDWLCKRLAAVGPAIERRRAAGRVRECHGDLHLANLVLHEGRMMAFDAIEFSESLRWIDVASDIAFLAMDLHSRGRPDLAAQAVSGWMEAADDHDAACVLPLYKVYRAIVRAAVAAIRFAQAAGDQAAQDAARAETDRYLDLAELLTRPRRPVLYATSGISGSGKTTVAAAIVGGCEAVRLRSDVERKRLFGMAATDRPLDDARSQSLYAPATTSLVYDRLAAVSRTLLTAGSSVVVDAAANRRAQRDTIAAVARETGVPLVWLDFDLPAEDVLARVAARQVAGTDASDATADVVRAQISAREPITAAELAAAGASTRRVNITAADLIDPTFVPRLLHDVSPG